MDLKQLEYIIAIADYGNITKAAEALFITQSGLNQQLIRLEKELNIQLFERNKRHLHLTQAGEIYVNHAREMIKLKHNAYSMIQDLADNITGDIFWGLPFEHGVDMFLYVSTAFNKRYPGITIHLEEHKVSDQHEMLSKGLLDLIFVMLKDKDKLDNEYIHLCNEKLVLGIPIQHPMAQYAAPPGDPLSTISLSHFRDDSFCLMFAGSTQRTIIDPLFTHAGFQPNLFCESTMNRTLSKLVEYNLCCTIMPQSYARFNNKVAWFYLDENPEWEWSIAHSHSMHLTKPTRYLIQLAKDYAHKMEEYWAENCIGNPNLI